MKKLQAILTEHKIVDNLLPLRKKQIATAITADQNDIEQQEAEAKIEYENLCMQLGAQDVVSYKGILNDMIACMNTINRAAETKEALIKIEKDLDSEVEVVE